MNRIGRLLRLICLTILISLLATGCRNFTLIGSVNLGSDNPGGQTAQEEWKAEDEADVTQSHDDVADSPCWPSGKAAFAELVAHGFTPKKYPQTEMWFRRLEPLAKSLPPCS